MLASNGRFMFILCPFLKLLAVLFVELVLCHFAEVVGVLVLKGEFGVLLDGFAIGYWLHADYVESLLLLLVHVFVLHPQQTRTVVRQIRRG